MIRTGEGGGALKEGEVRRRRLKEDGDGAVKEGGEMKKKEEEDGNGEEGGKKKDGDRAGEEGGSGGKYKSKMEREEGRRGVRVGKGWKEEERDKKMVR